MIGEANVTLKKSRGRHPKYRPHPLTKRVEELEYVVFEVIQQLTTLRGAERNPMGFLADIPKKAGATKKRKKR
jgi:hypothetical protein